MKARPFCNVTICLLALALAAGCGQKQEATPASQDAASADQGNGAAPGAPHVDASQSPTADPSSPLYGWEKFSSAEGKFSAIFPARPKEDDKTEQGKGAEVQMHLFIAETDAHNAYAAGYYDLTRVDDPKLVLARMEDGMIKKHNGKINSYKAMQWNGQPATEFEFTFGDLPNFSSTVRLMSDGLRVYVLMAIYATGQPPVAEREAFFNSFSLQ